MVETMRRLFFSLSLMLLAAAASPAGGVQIFVTDQPLPQIPVTLRPVLGGLEKPTSIAHAGDDRLFLTLQEGLVVIVRDEALRQEPFLDVRSLMTEEGGWQGHGGEQGLLGLAFHPRYAQNGLFFVAYTDRNDDVTVARYRVSDGDPDRADPSSGRILLNVPKPYINHHGGQLQFGPDGYLYLGIGDGGPVGDPGCVAQRDTSLLGKLLRLDVDANAESPPYHGIPPTNPFPGSLIWASGLRNPWRFSFDRKTGDLWIADVGEVQREEIDVQPAGTPGGRNFGWKVMEGSACFSTASCPVGTPACSSPAYTLPDLEYAHGHGDCSVTGGYVSRAPSLPHAWGVYFFGDLCSGRLWAAGRQEGGEGTFTIRQLPVLAQSVVTFGEDRAGDLWLATHQGGLFRLVPQHPVDTLGLYEPAAARFLFKDLLMDGAEDRTLRFGRPRNVWHPLAGDWNGDGRTTIGFWDPAARLFRLKNTLQPGPSNVLLAATPPSDRAVPLAGDWDGDGGDSVGFYDPRTSTFHLTNRLTPGPLGTVFAFGRGGLPVVGDWDGDGRDSVGLYVPGRGAFMLRNRLSAGEPDLRLRIATAKPAWLPLAGDWDGDGKDTLGLYDPATAVFYLQDVLQAGQPHRSIRFGTPGVGAVPLAGEW
jgi:glucose/arabinose dehydrogenase